MHVLTMSYVYRILHHPIIYYVYYPVKINLCDFYHHWAVVGMNGVG